MQSLYKKLKLILIRFCSLFESTEMEEKLKELQMQNFSETVLISLRDFCNQKKIIWRMNIPLVLANKTNVCFQFFK